MIETLLGYVLGFIYSFVNNYGWSLVIFTILVKLLLLPLTLKQQKSMVKMQQIQPKMQEIQTKYANDQQKQSQEIMALYKEYGVSPMGGCLPMLIQLPILFGLYGVIRKPLTYMLHMKDELANLYAQFPDIDTKAAQAELLLAKAADKINFDFLGLDLAVTPNITQPNWVWLIPVLAALTTYLTSKVSSGMNKKDESKKDEKPKRVLSPDQKTGSENAGQSMTKTMSMMMPVMTLIFTFTFPATLGVYWIISNVTSLIQTVVLNKHYKDKTQTEVAEKTQAIEQKKAEKKARYGHKKR